MRWTKEDTKQGCPHGLVDMIPIIVSPILLVQKPPELVIGEERWE